MNCNRCGVELEPSLPSPFAVVTFSSPLIGGITAYFCLAKCAPVVQAMLDHEWKPGDAVLAVPLTADGTLSTI